MTSILGPTVVGSVALKNPILLKFIIDKFKKVLVTFDLDAKSDLERTMSQVGLVEVAGYRLQLCPHADGKLAAKGIACCC